LLFLGSSCIYPRLAEQPMREDELLKGPLEPTNQWYAVAKIAGIKLCQAYRRQYGADFISVMPTNVYGPGDNYHPEHSHVVAALIAEVVGYRGKLVFDPSRPDEVPRKLLDSSKLAAMGWRARTPLRAGLEQTYSAFLSGNCRVH